MQAIRIPEDSVADVVEALVAGPVQATVNNANSPVPPTRPGQNSVGPPQNEADSSSLDEMFYSSPRPRTKPTAIPQFRNDPSRLAAGQRTIENRKEGLAVPFTLVSDAIRGSLDNAEKAKGGAKKILAKLMQIAHREAMNEVGDVFDSDAEGNPNSSDENLLECIRRVMVVEAVIHESSSNKGKGARKKRRLSSVPPGGALSIKGRPGESIPAMEQLNIREYSNQAYWRFAPYLEAVRCTVNPTRKRVTDYCRGSVPNSRNCISLIAKDSMMCKQRIFESCAGPWKERWSRKSWRPGTSRLASVKKTNQRAIRAILVLLACGNYISYSI
jgi:hypothetical protein